MFNWIILLNYFSISLIFSQYIVFSKYLYFAAVQIIAKCKLGICLKKNKLFSKVLSVINYTSGRNVLHIALFALRIVHKFIKGQLNFKLSDVLLQVELYFTILSKFSPSVNACPTCLSTNQQCFAGWRCGLSGVTTRRKWWAHTHNYHSPILTVIGTPACLPEILFCNNHLHLL